MSNTSNLPKHSFKYMWARYQEVMLVAAQLEELYQNCQNQLDVKTIVLIGDELIYLYSLPCVKVVLGL